MFVQYLRGSKHLHMRCLGWGSWRVHGLCKSTVRPTLRGSAPPVELKRGLSAKITSADMEYLCVYIYIYVYYLCTNL